MTDPENVPPTAANEQQLEQALREILGPLDRRIENFNTTCGLIMLGTLAAVFLLLWQVWDWQWWAALLWGGVGFIAFAVLMIPLEFLVVKPSVRDFNRRFPESGPERGQALGLLRELETPSKAEEKLLAALTDSLPGERIVRKRRLPSFTQIEAALRPFRRGGLPAALDSTPHIAPGPPAAPPTSHDIVARERPDTAPDRKDQ